MTYLTLGIRNLIKHKRKTILTILTISLGFACLLLSKGYANYCLWGLRESIINGGVGHYQIHKAGYGDRTDDDACLIRDYRPALRDFSLIPGVQFVAPRLSFTGLLAGRESSAIVVGYGGMAKEEERLMSFSTVERGSSTTNRDPCGNVDGMLIGSGVAGLADLAVGDECVLSAATPSGSVNAMDFTITGLVATQLEEMENSFAAIPLETAQALLCVPGSIDTLIVMLTDTDAQDDAEIPIRELCAKYGLEFRAWNEIVPYYGGASAFYSSAMNVALIVILSIVVFSIVNTMLMAMYARIRELGTMRSIGMNATQTLLMTSAESLLLGVFGCLAGAALAFALATAINAAGGIPLPPPPGNTRAYRGLIFIELGDAALYSCLFVLVALAASLVPARKAITIPISDALRWI